MNRLLRLTFGTLVVLIVGYAPVFAQATSTAVARAPVPPNGSCELGSHAGV